MEILDDLLKNLLSKYSDWIQVKDAQSRWTIEDFPYDTGVVESKTYPHCWKCVTVNQCWFKNENNKKPQKFSYSLQIIQQLFEKLGLDALLGLYHPHCHCKEWSIGMPTKTNIKVIVEDGKIDDFFNRKKGLATSWGYNVTDKEIFKIIFLNSVLNDYISGNYQLFKHDKFGVQITVFTSITGINEKAGKRYNFKTGFTVFPNGKIKNNTIFGGK